MVEIIFYSTIYKLLVVIVLFCNTSKQNINLNHSFIYLSDNVTTRKLTSFPWENIYFTYYDTSGLKSLGNNYKFHHSIIDNTSSTIRI